MIDTSKIARYAWIGRKDKNWYEECQSTFEELFGPEKLNLVCKLFAATSINTSLKSNITLFRKAYYEIENNLPIGKYLPNIQTQLQLIRDDKPLSGRKIDSFYLCMSGQDRTKCVVDVWVGRAFGIDRVYFRQKKGAAKGVGINRDGGISNKNYTIIENYIREEASHMGLLPAQLCAMIWAGVRINTNGDKETHYKELLRNKIINLFGVI